MRRLILFLWKHSNFVFFLLLEVLCFYLIVQNNSFQNASAFNSANFVSGNFYTAVNEIKSYFNLRETNQLLAEENARLRSHSSEAYAKYINTKYTAGDTVYRQQYQYTVAQVVNNSVNKRNNYLTLNKGSLHGITPEMAVITSNGIVGITKDVSPHFSSVLSVLNKNAKISARLKKSNYFGSLYWDGLNHQYGTLVDIPTHAKVQKGDTVVTTPYSAIFPDKITIGVIHEIEEKPGDNFYTLKVRFTTNFKNLSQVYVVQNIMAKEQRQLENKNQDDK
jgi:rod shape-determining protein MreC